MLVTNKNVLDKANKKWYAVGAFNFNNLEFMQAIIAAAEAEKSPAILQTSEGAIKYAGLENIIAMVRAAAKKSKVPLTLHLDHGKDLKVVKQCIDSGYTSVMIDGSHYDFEKNIAVTKKVVSMARRKGVSVEAELGVLAGIEDNASAKKNIFTNPDAAVEFAKRTKADALAIAIGTSHGAYKFKGESKLDFARLNEIKARLRIPIVLHGASGIPLKIVKIAEKYGAKLGQAHGVSDAHVRKAVSLGVNKVNIDSDLRLSFDAGIRKAIKEKPSEFDPRKILGPARDLITQTVRHKMRLFRSSGKG